MRRPAAAFVMAGVLALVPGMQPAHAGHARPAACTALAPAQLQSLAERAYIWGMPLVEAAKIRARFGADGTPLNRFKPLRRLAGLEMRAGVGPNNDTIYSLAWVDLADGPLVVTAPDFGDRYYTFSINLADSSAEQSFGQRTHGGQLPPLFLHSSAYGGAVPEGMIGVPSSTRYVNIAGRILVRSEAEYPEVNALQDRLAITRWADWRNGDRTPAPPPPTQAPTTLPAGTPPALSFWYLLGAVLKEWSVRPEDRAAIADLACLAVTPDHGLQPETISPETLAAMVRGYDAGREQVRAASLRLGVERDGWTTNYLGPRFGDDVLLRAAVAKDQIYVAIPEEAVYPVARTDAEGRPLDGAHRYRIRFEAGQLPPVDAFWSITAYDDTGFMIPNPIARYSVGDRTAGLVRGTDGRVTIEIGSAPPSGGADVTWLPVQDKAPFYLMMRLYRPRPSVLDQSWAPPPVRRVEP